MTIKIKIKIKLLEGLHLTSTERRHITELLDAGVSVASSRLKTYRAEKLGVGRYGVEIETKERDSQNRKTVRQHRVIIAASGLGQGPAAKR